MRNSSNRGTTRTQKNQRTNRTTPKSSTPSQRTTATTKRTERPVAKSSQPKSAKQQWLEGTVKAMTVKSTQRTTAKSSTPANNSENNYSSVAKNIYRDGSSYRARVSVNGIRSSRNFRTKREAVQWRNEMIAGRA